MYLHTEDFHLLEDVTGPGVHWPVEHRLCEVKAHPAHVVITSDYVPPAEAPNSTFYSPHCVNSVFGNDHRLIV